MTSVAFIIAQKKHLSSVFWKEKGDKMDLFCLHDLWERLLSTSKTVVMYGMGNGADKILQVCESKGITVSDFFASDGFVRGHLFHGKRVLS